MSFVHLDLHSEFSLVDSLIQLEPLMDALKFAPAVAITDVCNLFAMVKGYRAATSKGLKYLVGAELWIQEGDKINKLIAFCQHKAGYQNLTRLISSGYLAPHRDPIPRLTYETFLQYQTGLIILLTPDSVLGEALFQQKLDVAEEALVQWQTILGNRFYLTISRLGRQEEELYIQTLLPLAATHQCPLVATNQVRFLHPDDFEAHEARVCVQTGQTLEQRKNTPYTPEQYLKSPEAMSALFHDIPEAIQNTVEIAKRCSLPITLGHPVLPTFPVPEGLDEGRYLIQLSEKGLDKRFADTPILTPDKKERYLERLHLELKVIVSTGFAGYFLIVADFIQWAKDNGIPVGPGRGSGAGSLVAYALQITDLDPIPYELLFERFLNPERISMPDFDVDFCMDNRDRVIDYVADKYGRHSVSQIVTFGTMAAKAVVRDVGRVLGHPYGFVDKLAKLIPFEIGMTLQKALTDEPLLQQRYEDEEEVKNLIDLALKLEGVVRNVGKHAGGVVIAPADLTSFTPVYRELEGGSVVTQFDKDDVEAIGLVKFDFLGLRTLTIIDWAVKNVNQLNPGLSPIDITKIPLNDPKTFALLNKGTTTAVFQLESRGMKELISRLKPDAFEEIIALVALFRPGPLQSGMVEDFINRKHGRSIVTYPHPDCEAILKPTYGVILYQEQVMQLAQVLAGYTLGSADLLRRAMGKKKPEEMAQQREIFTKGALERGVEPAQANHIFDLMEKFAGYGFNKSHSAVYALVSYQTAWLKAHYPTAFMAAVLSADMNHTDKVVRLLEETGHMNIPVLPPNVNTSQYFFRVIGSDKIGYGLGAIKGVGEAAIDSILEARKQVGTFQSFLHFCQTVDTRKVNRRVIECLILSGAMDVFETERGTLMSALEVSLQSAEQQNSNRAHKQRDLFTEENTPVLQPVVWSDEKRLQGEKATLGLYLTGHPYTVYENICQPFITGPLKGLKVDQKVVIAGLLLDMRSMFTKKGDKMLFVTLDDTTARIELLLFSDLLDKVRHKLEKDTVLVVEGTTSSDKMTGQCRIRAENVYTLEEAQEKFTKAIKISLHASSGNLADALKTVLSAYEKGETPIWVDYYNDLSKSVLKLGQNWHVQPSVALLRDLKKQFGEDKVVFLF